MTRYGLQEEKHKSARQWKLTMEAAMDNLQQRQSLTDKELEKCKNQLKEMSKKSSEYMAGRLDLLVRIRSLEERLNQHVNPTPSTSINSPSPPSTCMNQQHGSNWLEQGKKEFSPLFSPLISPRNNPCNNQNDFKYQAQGTHKGKFKPVPYAEELPSGVVSQIHCISAMPKYEKYSLEELHWQDYNIANRAVPVQFFPPGTTLVPFSPHEGTDTKATFWGSVETKTNMMNISAMPAYSMKSPEELRLEDYKLKKPEYPSQKMSFAKTSDSLTMFPGTTRNPQSTWTSMASPSKPQATGSNFHRIPPGTRFKSPLGPHWHYVNSCQPPSPRPQTKEASTSVDGNTDQQPQLLQNIFEELKGITEKFSSLESRFTALEGSISDISSRVSVMDSKCSSVDMFLTMERIGKKWNALEPKLANLESPAIQNNSEASFNVSDMKSFLNNDTVDSSGSPNSSVSTHEKPSTAESSGIFSFGIESKKEITSFKFVYPTENLGELAGTTKDAGNPSTEVDLPSKEKVSLLDVYNKLLRNEEDNKNDNVDKMKTSGKQPEVETSTKVSNQENQTVKEVVNQENPLGQIETKGNSVVFNTLKGKEDEKSIEISSDEDDFIVIEKSDYRDASGNIVEGRDSSGEFELPDVTEYLEMASNKKMNKRYELGVEATDDSMLQLDRSNNRMSLDTAEVKDSSAVNVSMDSSPSKGSPPRYLFNDKRTTMMVFSTPSPSMPSGIFDQLTSQKNMMSSFESPTNK